MKTPNLTKNGLLMILSGCSVGLAIIIHILHRQFDFLSSYIPLNGITSLSAGITALTNILLLIPIGLFFIALWLFRKDKVHPRIPILSNINTHILKYCDDCWWKRLS